MLNARILSLAEAKGLEILTICDTCQANLHESARRIESGAETSVIVIEKLERAGVRYAKASRSRHLVKILADDIGLEALKRHVVRPLDGLRVATFGCCHVFRGPGAEPANRPLIEQMVSVTGGSVEKLRDDGDCCGFHLLMVDEELSARAAGRFVKKCAEAGADCIATSSPLCHAALDLYQRKAQQAAGIASPIPVLHIEQVLALSFGADASEIGLGRHMVSTSGLLEKVAA
jgi:succinate dehydrogenase / fumarate reductase cytochrome b subunit